MGNIMWDAEKRSYEKIFTGVTGKTTRVRDVEQPDAIAYTTEDGTIYLSEINELNKDLSKVYQRVFRKGVFVHEMLHQIFTNFKMENRMLRILPEREKQVYSLIHNILEDPSIEYWASTLVGGHLIRALRYAIALTYDLSPNIEESNTAFGQWVNAMIQFGDMGLLKGAFTFPEAKKAFFETSELFNKGIMEPSGAKRCQIARDLMEATRPLWEEDLKNQEEFEKMMNELMDMLEKMGKTPMSGSGSGSDADGEGDDGDKSSRRKKVIEVSKEEFDKMMKSAKPGKGNGDVIIKVKGDKGDKKESDKDKSKSDSYSEKSDEKESDKENSKDDSSSEKGNKDSNPDGDTDKNDSSNGNDGEYFGHTDDDGDGRITYDEKSAKSDGIGANKISDELNKDLILSDEELDFIEKEAQKSLEDYKIELNKDDEDSSPLPNFDIDSPRIGHQSCLNYRIGYEGHSVDSLERNYSKAVKEMNGGIKNLTVQLKRIFQNDYDEKEYRSSGKVNVKRVNSGRVSSRVFDKRRAPAEKSDLAIFLLIDESGSMSCGNKAYAASRCAIALSEVFNNLNIPIYVMGFTANTRGYDVVHNHYISWKNTHKDRIKLLNIAARANNTDGYSIRYATKILEKANAKNKLLIVISDGQPASNCYYGNSGVADTKDAIKEAKKKVSVLGVAVGNSDTDIIHYMYEKNFLHISCIEELFANLSKQIKNIIKEWD